MRNVLGIDGGAASQTAAQETAPPAEERHVDHATVRECVGLPIADASGAVVALGSKKYVPRWLLLKLALQCMPAPAGVLWTCNGPAMLSTRMMLPATILSAARTFRTAC